MSERPKFEGGAGIMGGAFGVGVIGLAATLFRAMNSDEGKQAYMVAFAYWFGIAVAALVLLMIWRAAKARWVVVIRRPLEVMASTVPLFALLFVPIYIWRDYYYLWASPHTGLDEELTHLLHHRANWLNPQTFLLRSVLYFVIFIAVSQVLFLWTTRQDQNGDPKLTSKSWVLGSVGLPFVGLALTFAAFDWYMSLEMKWFSSIWGVYYFAGSVLTVFSLLVVILYSLNRSPAYQGAMNKAHWLSIGKFMLAFTAFWAYIAFSTSDAGVGCQLAGYHAVPPRAHGWQLEVPHGSTRGDALPDSLPHLALARCENAAAHFARGRALPHLRKLHRHLLAPHAEHASRVRAHWQHASA